MAPPPSSSPPSAGGFLLVVAIFLGTGIGVAIGQTSAGLVGGIAAGAAIAVGLWIRDRRR